MTRNRLDALMVKKGLTETRAKAQAIIMAGEVLADERVVTKPGTLVKEETSIRLLEKPLFVSRGGTKLAYALDQFHLDVTSLVAVYLGGSTGGFTDCLLKSGAKRVYAIDVGYGQLDYRLRKDPRVITMERVNARYPVSLPEKVDIATTDLSFISATKVIPNIAQLLKDQGRIIALVKPQFEAGREEVGKGGVIKDPLIHARTLGRFISWAADHNLRIGGLVASPILGASGNREFFILLMLDTAR